MEPETSEEPEVLELSEEQVVQLEQESVAMQQQQQQQQQDQQQVQQAQMQQVGDQWFNVFSKMKRTKQMRNLQFVKQNISEEGTQETLCITRCRRPSIQIYVYYFSNTYTSISTQKIKSPNFSAILWVIAECTDLISAITSNNNTHNHI